MIDISGETGVIKGEGKGGEGVDFKYPGSKRTLILANPQRVPVLQDSGRKKTSMKKTTELEKRQSGQEKRETEAAYKGKNEPY